MAVRTALAVLFAAAPVVAAAAATAPSPGAPPNVLNVVRQTLKRGAAPAYEALEASIVRGYERAKIPLYWLCFQSPRNPLEILYVNLHDSRETAKRMADVYRDTVPRHPDLLKLQQKLSELGAAPPASTLTTRRDESVYGRADVDFATMGAVRLTVFHVNAGREGEFVDAATTGRPTPWLMYEATTESTFMIVAPLRSPSEKTAALPRRLRRLKGVYTADNSQTYALRPAMSHPPPAFRMRSTK